MARWALAVIILFAGQAPFRRSPIRSKIMRRQVATQPHPLHGNEVSRLLRFPTAIRRDPAIDSWMQRHHGELGAIAQHWFAVIRNCGNDVRELLHDGHPTACVGDAAFAYVNAFRAHVNVGFFRGAELADSTLMLEGTGRFMRHVKIRSGSSVDAEALGKLIEAAYKDMKARLGVASS